MYDMCAFILASFGGAGWSCVYIYFLRVFISPFYKYELCRLY